MLDSGLQSDRNFKFDQLMPEKQESDSREDHLSCQIPGIADGGSIYNHKFRRFSCVYSEMSSVLDSCSSSNETNQLSDPLNHSKL